MERIYDFLLLSGFLQVYFRAYFSRYWLSFYKRRSFGGSIGIFGNTATEQNDTAFSWIMGGAAVDLPLGKKNEICL
jgi:hypothetical protein